MVNSVVVPLELVYLKMISLLPIYVGVYSNVILVSVLDAPPPSGNTAVREGAQSK